MLILVIILAVYFGIMIPSAVRSDLRQAAARKAEAAATDDR